ncbi:MAG: hypothetical protein AAFZ06_11385 [Pseudomonadota bacterium]
MTATEAIAALRQGSSIYEGSAVPDRGAGCWACGGQVRPRLGRTMHVQRMTGDERAVQSRSE